MHATLIYPHQLFEVHPALEAGRIVLLIEEDLFFNQYKFHKQKLLFHRATMKCYADKLKRRCFETIYIESSIAGTKERIESCIKDKGITNIHCCEVDDDWLNKKLQSLCNSLALKLKTYDSPSFLTTHTWSKEYFEKTGKYFQTNFYIEQRKRLNILIDNKGKPVGGSWTFDSENRNKLPKEISFPPEPAIQFDKFIEEGRSYLQEHYSSNPGSVEDFIYPCSHEEARKFLGQFLEYKLKSFGTYQDALTTRSRFVFHSILSPLINVGLLTPSQVISATLDFVKHENVEINALEGLIRQIIGWREFLRAIYRLESRKQRTKNFFNFTRKIPKSFWDASTGILPIDSVINKVLDTAYAHHIERLMIMGNFMLLCEFDPDEVYEWFMTFFIDAYDWVMVPNVYGMSQYSDGGLIVTKPYISSSNYIRKMSDYESGNWEKIWDALYWRFINMHQGSFNKNPRMTMMIRQLERMDQAKLKNHISVAKRYIASLH